MPVFNILFGLAAILAVICLLYHIACRLILGQVRSNSPWPGGWARVVGADDEPGSYSVLEVHPQYGGHWTEGDRHEVAWEGNESDCVPPGVIVFLSFATPWDESSRLVFHWYDMRGRADDDDGGPMIGASRGPIRPAPPTLAEHAGRH